MKEYLFYCSGIVWTSYHFGGDATGRTEAKRLIAFDATNLQELWRDDRNIRFSKFTPPTIANEKVFLATFGDTVLVYGLLGQ